MNLSMFLTTRGSVIAVPASRRFVLYSHQKVASAAAGRRFVLYSHQKVVFDVK